MINFYIPDFIKFHNLNIFLIKLLQDYPQYFYDDIQIKGVYGCSSGCIWNGGRVINYYSNIELDNIKYDINYIINNSIKNVNIIERLFDRILSLVFIDSNILKPIYLNLLEYSKVISKDTYNYYKKAFDENFDNKILKKTK